MGHPAVFTETLRPRYLGTQIRNLLTSLMALKSYQPCEEVVEVPSRVRYCAGPFISKPRHEAEIRACHTLGKGLGDSDHFFILDLGTIFLSDTYMGWIVAHHTHFLRQVWWADVQPKYGRHRNKLGPLNVKVPGMHHSAYADRTVHTPLSNSSIRRSPAALSLVRTRRDALALTAAGGGFLQSSASLVLWHRRCLVCTADTSRLRDYRVSLPHSEEGTQTVGAHRLLTGTVDDVVAGVDRVV